jgi:CDP-glucose 4,6-dehydratase
MSTQLASFYRDKTVLVTGHTGFKGSWLSLWLKLLGAKVVGFALPPPSDRPSLFEATNLAGEVMHTEGDVRNLAEVESVFHNWSPEIVFHLAAQPLVRQSYRDPVTTYATNVLGTVHVLDAARSCDAVRTIICVTSDKCYQNCESREGHREDMALGGHDPYSSSKACAELVTAAFRDSYFSHRQVAVSSVRAGNVLGGGDWSDDRLVSDFVRAISRGGAIELRSPRAVRPWQFVLEPLHGYLHLARKMWCDGPAFAGPWNFGPDESAHVTVHELARRLIAAWGAGRIEVSLNEDPTRHETGLLALDSTKARRQLEWQPLLTLDEAIELTAEWYQVHLQSPRRAAQITRRQIEDYQRRMAA